MASYLSLLKFIFLTATDANHRDLDFSLETCIILCNIPPESYLTSAHCVAQEMHSCLTLQHILLPLSCLGSQRPATWFSGLNITKICQHSLTEYTSVPIPKSNLTLEIRKDFGLGEDLQDQSSVSLLERDSAGEGKTSHSYPSFRRWLWFVIENGVWLCTLEGLIFRTSARFH